MNVFDDSIINFIAENFHNAFTDVFFVYVTYLGELGLVWIVISLVMLISKKYRVYGFLALMALLLTFLIGEVVLKNIIARDRPFVSDPDLLVLIHKPSSFSFPSGHSGSSFTAATIFYFVNKKFGVCAYILAFLVAFSRVFLCVHYPTDVICGAVLGIIMANVVIFAYKKVKRRRMLMVEN